LGRGKKEGEESEKEIVLPSRTNLHQLGGTISMEASIILWEKWQEQVKELLPDVHGHQKKSLALSVIGIVLAKSAVLQRMAESVYLQGISAAKMPSIERRFARFVANERICVSDLWKQFLEQILPYWQGKAVQLVLDCTPFDDRATIVYIGLLVHSRVLPVAWRVMPNQEKWEQGQWELIGELLDQITPHLEPTDCTLIADRGLAGAPLVKLCRDRKWHYLLRVCKEHTCRRHMGKGWKPWTALGHIIVKEGQQWFGRVLLWQDEQTIETQLSAVWDKGHKEAWFLISDLPAGRMRVCAYARRMRVESTFQDDKSRGWDLEASLIEDLARLNRLLLALFIAMWWVTHLAASCIHHGKRDQFDRHDRRDKSIFRLGQLWLLDILRRACNQASLTWCLPFQKTAKGWRFALRF
jgi:hypothetical protein